MKSNTHLIAAATFLAGVGVALPIAVMSQTERPRGAEPRKDSNVLEVRELRIVDAEGKVVAKLGPTGEPPSYRAFGLVIDNGTAGKVSLKSSSLSSGLTVEAVNNVVNVSSGAGGTNIAIRDRNRNQYTDRVLIELDNNGTARIITKDVSGKRTGGIP